MVRAAVWLQDVKLKERNPSLYLSTAKPLRRSGPNNELMRSACLLIGAALCFYGSTLAEASSQRERLSLSPGHSDLDVAAVPGEAVAPQLAGQFIQQAAGKSRKGGHPIASAAAWHDLHISQFGDALAGISTHTSLACAAAFLSIVFLAAVVAVLSDSSLQGTGTDKEWRERSCLLDNAKFFCLVLVVFNNEVTVRKQATLAGAVDMIGMPMLCFISGLSAKGHARRRDVWNYFSYLVLPTLLWVFIVHPLIIIPLMYPSRTKDQFLQVITLQSFNLTERDLNSNMQYIWYLFPAMILWRGATLLLANFCNPVLILVISFIISCASGYVNLDDNTWKLPLNPVAGYLPYFAIGLVFPLEAACRCIYVKSEPACSALAAFLVALWVTVVVPTIFESLALPEAADWYGAPPQGETFGSYDTQRWDYRLYWTRRLCTVAADMIAVLVIMFLVVPRSKTWVTRAGRYTLYPYLFQQLASRYLQLLMQLLGFPDLADQVAIPLAVTWLHLPWAVAVVVVFSSTMCRCMFSWALEPVWFERLLQCVWAPRLDERALSIAQQSAQRSPPVIDHGVERGENQENMERGGVPSSARPW